MNFECLDVVLHLWNDTDSLHDETDRFNDKPPEKFGRDTDDTDKNKNQLQDFRYSRLQLRRSEPPLGLTINLLDTLCSHNK